MQNVKENIVQELLLSARASEYKQYKLQTDEGSEDTLQIKAKLLYAKSFNSSKINKLKW